MNNPTVAAYRALSGPVGATDSSLPAVVVMTSFFDSSFFEGSPARIASATGISYEVPLITAVTNLRKVMAAPIERIGVVLRPAQRGYVQRQSVLAAREQITVVEQEVSAEPERLRGQVALRKLKRRIDSAVGPQRRSPADAPPHRRRVAPRPQRAALQPDHRWSRRAGLAPAVVRDVRRAPRPHGAGAVQADGSLFDLARQLLILPPDAQVQQPLSTTTTLDLVQVKRPVLLRGVRTAARRPHPRRAARRVEYAVSAMKSTRNTLEGKLQRSMVIVVLMVAFAALGSREHLEPASPRAAR